MKWFRNWRIGNPVSRPRRRLMLERLEDKLCPAPYLLVPDGGSVAQVLRYSGADGSFVDQHSALPAGSAPDLGIIMDPAGVDYLVDGYGINNVLRYNLITGTPDPAPGQSGATFVASGSGGLAATEGLAYGADGNLYVASAGTSSVLLYDGTDGTAIATFVPSGSGGLATANDLHFGPDGHLYVDSFVNGGGLLRYDENTGAPLPADGQTGANFVPPHSGGLVVPNGFAWGPDGNIYLASDDTANVGSILVFDGTSGAYISTIVSGIGFIDGITFGADGNLYVTNNPGSVAKVTIYDTSGDLLGDFVSANSGGLGFAAGLLFYDDGTAPHPGQTHHTHPDSLPVSASLAVSSHHTIAGAVESSVLNAPPVSLQAPVAVQATTVTQGDSSAHQAAPAALDLVGHAGQVNLADPIGQTLDPLSSL